MNADGSYVAETFLKDLGIQDVPLTKMLKTWGSITQIELNWHNPSDEEYYLPSYFVEFRDKLEADLINRLKEYEIEIES
jgi:hypothetical protein